MIVIEDSPKIKVVRINRFEGDVPMGKDYTMLISIDLITYSGEILPENVIDIQRCQPVQIPIDSFAPEIRQAVFGHLTQKVQEHIDSGKLQT
jgi:hypothetical protein